MNAPNTITGLVVHKLIKERQGQADFVPRNATVEITPTVQRLIDQLHKLYAERQSKGYGKFEADENNFPMVRYARQYFVEGETDFYQLSLDMMSTLKRTANTAPLSTGGYVVIAHIFNGATDFLLVALVTDMLGTSITEGLEIIDSTHLDVANLRVAGRIDLTAWQNNDERYVSFLKGKGEVADYFKEFLGCNDVVIARQETQKLISCLKRFAESSGLDLAERDRLMQSAYDFCADLTRSNAPLELETLANRLWPHEPAVLRAAMADENLQLSDGFIPDKKALRSLVKFSAKTKAWRLEFEREAIANGEVQFNENDGTLTLTNLPQELINELRGEIGNE